MAAGRDDDTPPGKMTAARAARGTATEYGYVTPLPPPPGVVQPRAMTPVPVYVEPETSEVIVEDPDVESRRRRMAARRRTREPKLRFSLGALAAIGAAVAPTAVAIALYWRDTSQAIADRPTAPQVEQMIEKANKPIDKKLSDVDGKIDWLIKREVERPRTP